MNWQLETLTFIQQFKTPFLDYFFVAVTMTAEELFVILGATWFMWCFNKLMAQQVGLAFLTSTALNPSLKVWFAIDRPIGELGVESLRTHTAAGYSFPSGHTQGAATLWSGIAAYFKTQWIVVGCITMILLVALSRLYLGVHWPVDVFVGAIIGICWAIFVAWLFAYCQRHNKMALLWVIVVPLLIPYFAYWQESVHHKAITVSLGAAIGFLWGIFLEKKHINFNERANLKLQCLKMLIGLSGLLLIKFGLKPLLPFIPQISDLIRYTLLGLWITAGAPYIFKKLQWA